jgi:dihydroneopterin aldolase/2-amino-4-hydroxy-6-hydroxymethyldihydropteridine diphosphokinase/dihydropteroate synthase
LLKLLKRIEKSTGRTKTFTNGPRVVDLDLLFYGDGVVKVGEKGDEEDEDGVGWLEVPHWGIAEREFVLRPLNEFVLSSANSNGHELIDSICPMFIHPTLNLPISVILSRHPSNLVPIIPTPTPLSLDKKNTPLIMAIFNATPDSFSDGSESNLNLTTAIANIRSIFESAHRPDILDIGGMSTRPNSVPCSEEEELKRVVPLIKAIRKEERWKDVVISIDTYRPTVAKAAVEAGANIINDVRGGREEGMMSTMAELGVPVILMHSRGDSTTMTKTESQEYPEGVVRGVQAELGQTVERAIQSGIRSWDIIIDPGIGFAKSQSQSIHLLRHIDEISTLTTGPDDSGGVYPVLVGASRKGFVGKITGREEASERGWGDAVVNAFCVHAGQTTLHGDEEGERVGILRVHDWRGARESVKMAKAFFAEEE